MRKHLSIVEMVKLYGRVVKRDEVSVFNGKKNKTLLTDIGLSFKPTIAFNCCNCLNKLCAICWINCVVQTVYPRRFIRIDFRFCFGFFDLAIICAVNDRARAMKTAPLEKLHFSKTIEFSQKHVPH